MIDLTNETVLSFADAAGHLPRHRAGKKPHVATIYRWTTRGCRSGVSELAMKNPGRNCSS